MNMNMKRNQTGFTIIELIVTIALLGILSAVALPRFISITDDAHTANVRGAAAGFVSGLALIRAQAITEGVTSGAVDGYGTGNLWVNNVPAPTSSGSAATVNCVEVWNLLLQSNAPTVSTAAGSDYQASSTGTPSVCTYTYDTEDNGTARTIIYTTSTGEVSVVAEAG
ncbi:MAG: MSHA pilin protein MshB [Motiliproteus sp.]|jgi:MSHA pilin protein MshB